jgi:hypothetical protein
MLEKTGICPGIDAPSHGVEGPILCTDAISTPRTFRCQRDDLETAVHDADLLFFAAGKRSAWCLMKVTNPLPAWPTLFNAAMAGMSCRLV